MRSAAGFDAHPCRRQLVKKLNDLPSPQLPAQHGLLGAIHAMQLKNTLGRVHTNADKIIHGRLPCLRSLTTSFWHIDAVGGRPPQQHKVKTSRGRRSPSAVRLIPQGSAIARGDASRTLPFWKGDEKTLPVSQVAGPQQAHLRPKFPGLFDIVRTFPSPLGNGRGEMGE